MATITELEKARQAQNKKIRYEVVTVTPEKATKWLEGNVLNRDITQSHVEWLARQMRDHKWYLSNNAIAFDDNEQHPLLLDGQHRLWAIIMSGVTVQMLVGWGFSHDLQKIIDTRRSSTPAAGEVPKMPRRFPGSRVQQSGISQLRRQ